ncbi:GAF domain-containing protein [Pseudonocardia xinjiangensis]|uniref:GAF domain-containing protein n=1 Tax=Pseudonocardia xinjiangensis TaxID=75289 RepID=UPI003D8D9FFA
MSRTALELLRLLAQDAPAERIDEQSRALAEADPQTAAVARELALRVRSGIDAQRRREAELSALVDIARDLASRPEPGGVLDAIVRRARSLLSTDVAYLTLADAEQGDTFMRATAGSVSAAFQALRLPQGAGLGGLVAQTRRPYWTADYPGDERYAHTSEIDSAVDEEGLVAICGTPLLVDGEFVGVLFAANRSRRPFNRSEVALLGSLAALAAVSLVQSRRAAETAQALAALSSAHAGIEQAAAAHDRFAGVVLSGGGVDDIAAALGELLGCWVAVLDVDDQRIASHGPAPAPGPDHDPLATAEAVRHSAASGRLAEAGGVWAVVVSAARPAARHARARRLPAAGQRAGPHRGAGGDGDRARAAVPAPRGRGRPAGAHRPARRPARPPGRPDRRRTRRARTVARAAAADPARGGRVPRHAARAPPGRSHRGGRPRACG